MVVKIEEIGKEGLSLDVPIGIELLEDALAKEGKETGFRPLRGAHLKASLQKVSGGVLLKGEFKAEVWAPCKRCLAETTASLPVSFALRLIPRELAQKEEGRRSLEEHVGGERTGSFRLEEADREWFDGRKIDLDPILQEQVLLALPMSLVCRESCRGLCPVCGENLNEKQCGCEREVVDPRWMALKNVKLN
jgi:uncharacterized protein